MDGNRVASIGLRGAFRGSHRYSALKLNSLRDLLVRDHESNTVEVFDVRSGSAVWNFGHFKVSVNIRVDSFDQVIVSDFIGCKLYFFDSKFDQFHVIETINKKKSTMETIRGLY